MHKPTHDYDDDRLTSRVRTSRKEFSSIDGVRYDGDVERIERRAQYRVLLGRVGYANHVIAVRQGQLEQMVGNYRAEIGKAEKRVIGEARSAAEAFRMENCFVCQCGERRVAVNDIDRLACDYIAEEANAGESSWKARLFSYIDRTIVFEHVLKGVILRTAE